MDVDSRLVMERRVLAALFEDAAAGPLRESARRQLADYVWYEAAHQALFEIAMSLPAANARAWRDQLPARLTRRGFPDFDFAALFAEPPLSLAEAEECIERLRET